MKTLRPWAEFDTTLAYDGVENEEGTAFLQYPGKAVATAMSEMFGKFGCEVDGPHAEGDHGWRWGLRVNGRAFWCQVTMIEKYVFCLVNPSWLDGLLGRTPPTFVTLLRGIARALEQDPRFSNVAWFESGRELGGVGHPRPIDD